MKRSLTMRQILSVVLVAMLILPAPMVAASVSAERSAQWAVPVDTARNLYRITPQLYRSAQIEAKDVALLQSIGIKTVVSLRAFHSDHKLLANSGIRHRRIKVLTWKISDDDIVTALRTIRAAEKEGPVLLHCQHGADRTGLVSAMYRMLYQNWTREQALEELREGNYGYHSMWKNIPEYLDAVDVETIRRRVEAE
jgi:protein tyrosine/serine phosphatase